MSKGFLKKKKKRKNNHSPKKKATLLFSEQAQPFSYSEESKIESSRRRKGHSRRRGFLPRPFQPVEKQHPAATSLHHPLSPRTQSRAPSSQQSEAPEHSKTVSHTMLWKTCHGSIKLFKLFHHINLVFP